MEVVEGKEECEEEGEKEECEKAGEKDERGAFIVATAHIGSTAHSSAPLLT